LGEFPEVRAECERIARALRPLGPCNIQLRTGRQGPTCIEINARFSGTTPIRAHFGFNEVDAFLRNHVLGETVALPRVTEGVAMRYWNELYVTANAYDALERDGKMEGRGGSVVENYGMHP
jgi:carbamoyl-phosphate synthase large subunit